MNSTYVLSNRVKNVAFAFMGIGLLSIILGYAGDSAPEGVHDYHHNRFWANILINSFFFMGIALAATFFLGVQYAAEAGWATTVKRIIEAVTTYLPYGLAFMVVLLMLGEMHVHKIWMWQDRAEAAKDHILSQKAGYFSVAFFWARVALYVFFWWWFGQRGLRKLSLEADEKGDSNWKTHKKSIRTAAIFLVIFGFTSSVMAWDWIMSIDAHWFSTIFGWYLFSGMWIGAIISIIMIVLYLKKKGLLQEVTESTVHDLGKWMFAVSFLWTYLWFCQFMLIWYSDIPEEVVYYAQRWEQYKFLFWFVAFINFVFPILMLMSRDCKRNFNFLFVVGCIIFVGHWLDMFMIVMPGTVGAHWHLGLMELGIALGFLGLFVFVVMSQLAKYPIVVKSHPYLEESKHLST